MVTDPRSFKLDPLGRLQAGVFNFTVNITVTSDKNDIKIDRSIL